MSSKQVVCFFDDLNGIANSDGISYLWEHSWRKHGWETRISNSTWLPDHPMHKQVAEHIDTLPTVNPPEYERLCYLRWLAAETSGARLFTDMDVICNGFRPEHLEALNQDKVVSLIHNGCPAAVYMPKGFSIYPWILNYKAKHALPESGMPHCSDQSMFLWLVQNRRDAFVSIDLCKDYGDAGWQSAPLIHFASGAVRRYSGKTKRELIAELFPAPVPTPTN